MLGNSVATITKYFDAEITSFASLLELHEYKHFLSLINIYVIYTKFLLIKFDIFLSTEEKHGTDILAKFAFQSVKHYMKAMVRVSLVPRKLYYFFKTETSVLVMNSEQQR